MFKYKKLYRELLTDHNRIADDVEAYRSKAEALIGALEQKAASERPTGQCDSCINKPNYRKCASCMRNPHAADKYRSQK